ncbi:hypothetical protein EJC49_04450 [Aquibium carbonis]|uniref:Uncharacterized protein n=1 Tax=Aquibium carbonis TaxID=2495581 RepID=A0A429Z1L6_9HYPH|nr:hypothetical protein [Aquibium carbonis]RST87605.1 hypothetical protein EJC49_04450 [Aquibium carbonis]
MNDMPSNRKTNYRLRKVSAFDAQQEIRLRVKRDRQEEQRARLATPPEKRRAPRGKPGPYSIGFVVGKEMRYTSVKRCLPGYGHDFCIRLASSLQRGLNDKPYLTARSWVTIINGFLVAASEASEGSSMKTLHEQLTSSDPAGTHPGVLEAAIEEVAASIDSPDGPVRRRDFKGLSDVLELLSVDGIVPAVVRQKLKATAKPWHGARTKSLAELGPDTVRLSAVKVESHVRAMCDLNVKRMAALRSCAVRELQDCHRQFRWGQEAMARPDLADIPQIRELANMQLKAGTQQVYLDMRERLFPKSDPDRALASLLRYIRDELGGVIHYPTMPAAIKGLVIEFGGPPYLVPLLEGTPKALNATHVIVLIDTEMSVDPVYRLAADPFVGKAQRGKQEITTVTGLKMRARGEFTDGDLLEETGVIRISRADGESVSGTEAIRIWKELSEPIRQRARKQGNHNAAEHLFIAPSSFGNSGPVAACSQSIHGWFNAFLQRNKEDPDIGGLKITRRMIRATGVQIKEARGERRHALAVTQHKGDGRVFMGYTDAPYLRSALLAQIREFTALFEAILVNPTPAVAERLRTDLPTLEERRSRAVATGLGTMCEDPFSGVAPGSEEGQACDVFEWCPRCPVRSFRPLQKSMEDLYLMNARLREAEQRMLVNNPARWERVWLPWLAMTEAFIGKLKQGMYAPGWRRACLAAEIRVASGETPAVVIQ